MEAFATPIFYFMKYPRIQQK